MTDTPLEPSSSPQVTGPRDIDVVMGRRVGSAPADEANTRHGGPAVTTIAFYLPQFHPVPENDEWWGPGFTEWRNVTQGRPLFRGHEQPRLPADLGFYDLRVPEARQAQADLARRYGVHAFCYWHYWFAGRQILQRPFEEVLRSGTPDFPFCLAWANQSWTGIWHGAPDRLLLRQDYPGAEDDRRHFDHLLPAFVDERYVRVDGRPLFYVFRPEELPDPATFVDRWQAMAVAAGLPGLFLVAEVSDLLGDGPRYVGARRDGFDAGLYVRIPVDRRPGALLAMRARRKLRGGPEVYPCADELPSPPPGAGNELLPCVYPNWDNTPRSARLGVVVTGTSPERFRLHVRRGLALAQRRPTADRLLFIKSWNEWAEGNYLEPDLRHGRGYLQVLAEELAALQLAADPGGAR